jgi:hypothetical protein
MYARDASINSGALSQTEMSMYGSSRLGVWNINRSVANIDTVNYYNFSNHFARGNKLFELGNHLGNVLVTISDKKIGVDEAYTLSCATCPLVLTGTTNGIIDYYKPDVMTANDYYPGMMMPGRKYEQGNSSYRYGFNGQEKSDEISGAGNHYTAEFWEMDPRLCRRWNIDPVVKPFESGYACFGNNPIWFIDHNGADTTISGSITAQSEIMKKASDPDFVPPGVKLESTAKINATIVDGKFTSVKQEITPKEFESPVLGGIKPAFTRVSNHSVNISKDGLTATLHYEVET